MLRFVLRAATVLSLPVLLLLFSSMLSAEETAEDALSAIGAHQSAADVSKTGVTYRGRGPLLQIFADVGPWLSPGPVIDFNGRLVGFRVPPVKQADGTLRYATADSRSSVILSTDAVREIVAEMIAEAKVR